MSDFFTKLATKISEVMGHYAAFLTACGVIITWAVIGPSVNFSDTWQLVINTGTTIVTFLVVFLIQNTQNRDSKAIHLKLDELIHAIRDARNNLIHAERLSEKQIDTLSRESEI